MGIVVLSLFDGISGGMIALERAGIAVDKYFASEVDKYAEMISKYNYPQIIRLGDVRNIDTSKFPKIDLLIGGSPCQSFSMAGKRKGMVTKCEIEVTSLQQYLELKEQGFEFEGQSYLFWEFIRIKEAIQPDYFFLENVWMVANWASVISQAIGIQPIMINSALVSAQNRERYYWTNIGAEPDGLFGEISCKIPQPEDMGKLLKDIIEKEVDEKYYLSKKTLNTFIKHRERNKEMGKGFGFSPRTEEEKSISLTTGTMKSTSPFLKEGSKSAQGYIGNSGSGGQKGVIFGVENKIGDLCATDYKQPKQIMETKDSFIVESFYKSRGERIFTEKSPTLRSGRQGLEVVQKGKNCLFNIYDNEKNPDTGRVYSMNGKSITLKSEGGGGGAKTGLYLEDNSIIDKYRIRRLAPIECERLQTLPDNYTQLGISEKGEVPISDTQRFKAIGNGWTIEVIAHIFSYLPTNYKTN